MSSSRGGLTSFWSGLQRRAKAVGDFQARLILNLLYGLLILPTGFISKIDGDLLEAEQDEALSYWQKRPSLEESLRQARKQG